MRVGREVVEDADLKEPAKGQWVHREARNRSPSLQRDAGAGPLDSTLRIRGSRAKWEVVQKGWVEEVGCLHGIRREEKVTIVNKNHCCQSSPLTKPWVMRKCQPHWTATLVPFQHIPQIVGPENLLSFNNESKSKNPSQCGLQGKGRRNRKKMLDKEYSQENVALE